MQFGLAVYELQSLVLKAQIALAGQSMFAHSGKLIQILPSIQPNQILIHKPTRIRIIVPEEVEMQPRLTVGILVLQAERVGEQFIARFGNPAQFVVFEIRRIRSLIGTVGQVAGTVVAVAKADDADCFFIC